MQALVRTSWMGRCSRHPPEDAIVDQQAVSSSQAMTGPMKRSHRVHGVVAPMRLEGEPPLRRRGEPGLLIPEGKPSPDVNAQSSRAEHAKVVTAGVTPSGRVTFSIVARPTTREPSSTEMAAPTSRFPQNSGTRGSMRTTVYSPSSTSLCGLRLPPADS